MKALNRLGIVIGVVIGMIILTITILPEILFYGIRWILTGKGFPSNPFMVRYIGDLIEKGGQNE